MSDPVLLPSGDVGLFWVVEMDGKPSVLYVSARITDAQSYGDHRMLDLGHFEHWENLASRGALALRAAGLPTAPTWSEYEEWPRGRVSYDMARHRFVIRADRKLHNAAFIALILKQFGILPETAVVTSDPHYVSTRRLPPPTTP